jgi:uncharacterized membrane protein YeaQ/YmgE (transglycosylase-associated protein family)
MQSKRIVTLFMIAGSFLGGYVPAIWGSSYFSFSSIIFSGLGAVVGIYIGFKISQ